MEYQGHSTDTKTSPLLPTSSLVSLASFQWFPNWSSNLQLQPCDNIPPSSPSHFSSVNRIHLKSFNGSLSPHDKVKTPGHGTLWTYVPHVYLATFWSLLAPMSPLESFPLHVLFWVPVACQPHLMTAWLNHAAVTSSTSVFPSRFRLTVGMDWTLLLFVFLKHNIYWWITECAKCLHEWII